MYGMPEEIDVQADGALRIITLNRPDALNAVNDNLHVGLARLWEALNEDADARAAVITGAGRAFSAGGDFNWVLTWPELDAVTLDLYVCNFSQDNRAAAEAAYETLKAEFQPQRVVRHDVKRGAMQPLSRRRVRQNEGFAAQKVFGGQHNALFALKLW